VEWPARDRADRLDTGVLASAPFYASGTFWAAVAVAVAIVGIGVPVLLWKIGAPRRLITYSVLGTTPLLRGGHWPGLHRAQFQVLMDGKPLTNPYVTLLRVENRSRRDIRSSDFDQRKPLLLELGTKFEYAADAGSTIDYQSTINTTETAISMGPMLMPAGKSLQITLLTEGPPHITCPNPPLIDVKVVEERPYAGLIAGRYSGAVIGIAVITAAIGAVLPTFAPSHMTIFIFDVIATIVLVFIFCAVYLTRRRATRARRISRLR
jgi:hypothetical protein